MCCVDIDHILGTQSQANGTEVTEKSKNLSSLNDVFQNISEKDRGKEEARLLKRQKRNVTVPGADAPAVPSTPVTPGTPTPLGDGSKRVTKKDQKVAEAKFTEAQQHKHANETARMATSNLLGGTNLFGKKKTFSWLQGGASTPKPAPGPVPTAANINTALNEPTPVAKTTPKPALVVPKSRQFGDWDEACEKEMAIEAQDILAVLDHDDRAWRSLQKGYNKS